jgi:hypothetical protein
MISIISATLYMSQWTEPQILKAVTSEKVDGSGVTSTPGTFYEGVVMGVILYTLMRPPSCIEPSTLRHYKSKI